MLTWDFWLEMARALFLMEKFELLWRFHLVLNCWCYWNNYILNFDILSCLPKQNLLNLTFYFCRQHQGVLQTERWWGSRRISQREELFQRRPLRRGRSILLGPCCLDSSYLLSLDPVRLILCSVNIISVFASSDK